MKSLAVLFVTTILAIILTGKLLFSFSLSFLFFYGFTATTLLATLFIVSHFFYRDPYLEAIKNNIKPDHKRKATCIVAVRNEEDIIDRCILSLINQTYPNLEIIIVDDKSTDKTAQIIREYSISSKIRALFLTVNVGKKKAISKAIEVSTGEIFIFSDSDSVLEPQAVEKIMTIFEASSETGAISGHCRALNAQENFYTKVQDSWYEGQFSVRKAFESIFGAVTCVSGPLAAFRRETIFNFIPAWENDRFLGKEFKFATDRTLTGFVLGNKWVGDKLKKKYKTSRFVTSVDYPLKEWKIVYSKSTKAWTNVPNSFGKMIKQQIRWKKSFIRNVFFTGSFYWMKPLPVAIVYYLHVLFVIVGPFIALKHLVLLPLGHDFMAPLFYIAGIILIGFMFGISYKIENPDCHRWIYRPVMSLFSTLIFSWLLFYSAYTIRKMIWHRS